MEISEVRKQVVAAIERAKHLAAERRMRTDEAARAYDRFLESTAVPLFRQVANVLKVTGHPFRVSTPQHSVQLASERNPADLLELALDTEGDRAAVLLRWTRNWGSQRLAGERPLEADPSAITEDALLTALLDELLRFLDR